MRQLSNIKKKFLQLLQKSVITPDFEKKECVPPFRESLHQLKKQRRVSEELVTPQITKQALVESPILGLCAYNRPHWKWSDELPFSVFLQPSCEKPSFLSPAQ